MEELCEKFIEIRSVSDRVMTVVLLCRGCAEVDLLIGSAKWKNLGRKTVFL